MTLYFMIYTIPFLPSALGACDLLFFPPKRYNCTHWNLHSAWWSLDRVNASLLHGMCIIAIILVILPPCIHSSEVDIKCNRFALSDLPPPGNDPFVRQCGFCVACLYTVEQEFEFERTEVVRVNETTWHVKRSLMLNSLYIIWSTDDQMRLENGGLFDDELISIHTTELWRLRMKSLEISQWQAYSLLQIASFSKTTSNA